MQMYATGYTKKRRDQYISLIIFISYPVAFKELEYLLNAIPDARSI